MLILNIKCPIKPDNKTIKDRKKTPKIYETTSFLKHFFLKIPTQAIPGNTNNIKFTTNENINGFTGNTLLRKYNRKHPLNNKRKTIRFFMQIL